MKFNALIPELSVSNLEISLHFYVDLIGFKIEYSREESQFVFLSLLESQIMLEQHNGHWSTASLEYPLGRGINFQIDVPLIDEILLSLSNVNYPLMKDPWQTSYRIEHDYVHQREFLVQDPDGYVLRISQVIY